MANEAVYIFENIEAQRVKVGITINQPADRLRSINEMWTQLKATCQVCGGRRLINLRDGFMPTHSTCGPHHTSGLNCAGSLKPPLERDVSIAEYYLDDLKQRHSKSTGTEKGSLTRMIRNLEERIERFRYLELPVGQWRIGVVFYTGNAEAVESLAHQMLDDRLDKQAPFGEVFCCSVSEATEAVETALSQLGLLHSARKETQLLAERTLYFEDKSQPIKELPKPESSLSKTPLNNTDNNDAYLRRLALEQTKERWNKDIGKAADLPGWAGQIESEAEALFKKLKGETQPATTFRRP